MQLCYSSVFAVHLQYFFLLFIYYNCIQKWHHKRICPDRKLSYHCYSVSKYEKKLGFHLNDILRVESLCRGAKGGRGARVMTYDAKALLPPSFIGKKVAKSTTRDEHHRERGLKFERWAAPRTTRFTIGNFPLFSTAWLIEKRESLSGSRKDLSSLKGAVLPNLFREGNFQQSNSQCLTNDTILTCFQSIFISCFICWFIYLLCTFFSLTS